MAAASKYMTNLTVNEARNTGLVICFDLLDDLNTDRVTSCYTDGYQNCANTCMVSKDSHTL